MSTLHSISDLSLNPDCELENPLHSFEESLTGYRRFQAMITACNLGIFTACIEPTTACELSESLGTHPDLTELLADVLVAEKLLVKSDGQYSLTSFSKTFLISESPVSQLNAIRFQSHLAGLWTQLVEIMRSGPRMYPTEEWFCDLVIPSMAENCRCGLLQKVTKVVTAQPEFSSARTLLDLGGGHGLYAIAFCQYNPNLSATVFDLPQVTMATCKTIAQYCADRVTTKSGNFFTDSIGSGYDIIFSSSNPGGKSPALIKKIADALNEGGLYINKQGKDESLDNPLLNLEWNLWTVSDMHKERRQYSFSYSVPFAEYNRLLADYGFVVREVVPIDAQSAMTIAEKVAK